MKNKATLIGYAATRVLDTPFWAIYNLLPFILYKDLGASPFQVAFLVALKPLVSLLAMYWSSPIRDRPDKLVRNILWARLLSYAPFVLVPFVSTPWFYIAIYGLYMMLSVGAIPAWMEILKVNLPKETREKTFAYTQAFGYMGGGLIPFALGWAMDSYIEAWRWLFPLAAAVGFSAVFFQMRMQVDPNEYNKLPEPAQKLVHKIKEPWTAAYKLLKERVDFRKFQIGFMFVGGGLMLIYPALPVYFMDNLKLSYLELSVAITLCKGLGVALATPWWAQNLNKKGIFSFASLIAALTALFPFCLMLAATDLVWLWGAYLLYGIAQAGSELCWNMSGPIFAKEKDSSLFSAINVVAIGLRGAILPALGSLIVIWGSSALTMVLGGFVCLSGAILLSYFGRQPAYSQST